jgi:hypothetical protein
VFLTGKGTTESCKYCKINLAKSCKILEKALPIRGAANLKLKIKLNLSYIRSYEDFCLTSHSTWHWMTLALLNVAMRFFICFENLSSSDNDLRHSKILIWFWRDFAVGQNLIIWGLNRINYIQFVVILNW